MKVSQALQHGASSLPRRTGLPDPRRESAWLLAAAWAKQETWLRAHPEAQLPAAIEDRYLRWIGQRSVGVPAHHLTGECTFWGRDFAVTPSVLIPRPESELIIETALQLSIGASSKVLDIGTGSGCLAVTLAIERPGWKVFGIDRSFDAIAVAKRNVRRWEREVWLGVGDLATPVTGAFELIVANLPYVPQGEIGALSEEVRHEPMLALDGGPDGLREIRRLLGDVSRILKPCGGLILELGEDQADEVAALARRERLAVARRIRDLAGCERVLVLQAA